VGAGQRCRAGGSNHKGGQFDLGCFHAVSRRQGGKIYRRDSSPFEIEYRRGNGNAILIHAFLGHGKSRLLNRIEYVQNLQGALAIKAALRFRIETFDHFAEFIACKVAKHDLARRSRHGGEAAAHRQVYRRQVHARNIPDHDDFDGARAETWIGEWEDYYDAMRSFYKPLVVALNGTAAGSAFQVALLGDIRIAHEGVKMGQPEINSGIASVTGPWLMREMLGMSRTIELTLTGRMMDASECHAIGLVHHLVPQSDVFQKALGVAQELAAKPPVAMRLDKTRFREVSEASFRETIQAAVRIHHESYASGEPARMMEAFFAERSARRGVPTPDPSAA
jgi:enoyl-CoA hydratase